MNEILENPQQFGIQEEEIWVRFGTNQREMIIMNKKKKKIEPKIKLNRLGIIWTEEKNKEHNKLLKTFWEQWLKFRCAIVKKFPQEDLKFRRGPSHMGSCVYAANNS